MLRLVCPCLFGLEKTLAFEIRRAGGENLAVRDGKVFFDGSEETMARVNLTSSCAERVGIVLGEFSSPDFDTLFEGALASPIEQFAGRDDAFPVVGGHSVNSKFTSIPAVQRTIKKALAVRMGKAYKVQRPTETGQVFPVHFLLQKDFCLLTLDTSGDSLHKRGYRAASLEAPIRETLAAGMIDLAHVRSFDNICDPFCGSGTILIEAALKMLNIAPNMNRSFAAEKWDCFDKNIWEKERLAAKEQIKQEDVTLYGFDKDPAAVRLTMENARKAGVDKYIKVRQREIADFHFPIIPCKVITNPPYAKRLLTEEQAEDIYRTMGERMLPLGDNRLYVITSNENFPALFGEKPKKERKLYNGMLKCRLYIYE